MANILEEIGARIRSLRKASGLSQQALAERAGVSYKYLGEIERGQVNLSVEILMKIAEALHVKAGEILDKAAGDEVSNRASYVLAELPEKERALGLQILELLLSQSS